MEGKPIDWLGCLFLFALAVVSAAAVALCLHSGDKIADRLDGPWANVPVEASK